MQCCMLLPLGWLLEPLAVAHGLQHGCLKAGMWSEAPQMVQVKDVCMHRACHMAGRQLHAQGLTRARFQKTVLACGCPEEELLS
jgi:hypothetical protein